MKALKFRAWEKPYYGGRMFTEKDNFAVANEKWVAFLRDGEYIESEVECIEQYTGLTDKNGKDIYEGDIVKVCNKHVSSVYMHPSGEWVLPQFLDKEDKPITSLLWHCDKKQVEVIGNIHENPELLEEGK